MFPRFAPAVVPFTLAACFASAGVAQESAGALLETHHYAQSVQAADAGLKTEPNDARLWVVKGLALAGLGKIGPALGSLDHALKLTGDDGRILEAAAQIGYGARDARAQGYLDRLLARDPANQVAHAMSGALAYERKDCAGADAHFAQAGAALDGNVPAQMQYGDCLLQTGDTARGMALFEQLAAAHPGDPVFGYDRAVAEMQASRFADAVEVLRAIQAGGPLNGDAANLLGAAYNANGQLAEAIAAYRAAAAANPHDDRNWIDLATVSVEHQSPEAALKVLDAGIAQNPGSGALLAMRGAVRAQLSDNDGATQDFEAANRLEPSKLYGAVGLGVLLRDTSKLPEAEALLRQRLGAHPNDATLNYLVADVLIREGAAPGDPKFAEAHKLLLHAVALKPDLAVAYGELGKLDLKDGHSEAAIAELEKGVKYDSTDRTSLNQLVAAYRRAGRSDDAARVAGQLAKAVEHDRTEQTERNRVHITVASSPAAEGAPQP